MTITGTPGTRGRTDSDLGWDQATEGPSGTPRDWKRLMLVVGLGGLSWVATFVGMLELIEANVGDLPIAHKAIIGFSVAMLMVMVVWLLDQIFSDDVGWLTRLVYVGGYVFLTAISVGFGFGFYWKVLESRGESSRSAEAAVGQVQNALFAGVTRLEQLQSTLDGLARLSGEKAALERQNGNSCPGSRPGDGPRRQLRDDDAGRFKFAADFVRGRVGTVKGELGGLGGDLAKVSANDRSTVDAASGTRNDFMRGLNRRLDMTVTGFNAFRTDPQLKQLRADLAERADRVTFPDTRGGTFQCPDAQLSTALKGVVRAIDDLPMLEKPKIAAVEGSEAVIEAFRRLSASMFGALAFKMPPSPEELRELQKKAVQSVEASPQTQARLNAMAAEAGLSKRDYVPLAIALFVDLCLLLVSIKRRGSPLERLVPKMRAAERGPVIQILSRFNEIHRDKEIRENFEVFRHVVFDFHGDYYAAVPLNAPYRANPRNGRQMMGYGAPEAEALLQEAHLLSNLFSSFEKERIFTRVMSPLLTTAMVQRRLRRQGSKFANAEAFRLYRFRDGAWSEIILGAVMGAAKRVEAGQRRRRIEDEMFRSDGPELAPSTTAPRREPAPSPRGEPVWGASGRHTAGYADPDGPPARQPFTPRVVPGAREREPQQPAAARPAANSNTAPQSRPASDERSQPQSAENVVPHPAIGRAPVPGRPAPSERLDHEAAPPEARMATSGPASGLAAPGDDTVREPTGSATPEAVASPVIELAPAAVAAEPTITVAATRESVTYTLPVSEARLPATLLARLGSADRPVAEPPASVPSETAAPPALPPRPVLPPPARPTVAAAPAPTETADEIRTLALRFGPGPRET
ncbi:MAG: hypothetical protein AB7O57_02020 [Hyphomicrobiaceae bacterium]